MPSSWSRQLNRELKSLVKSDSGPGEERVPRIAFMGIGNEFKADDIFGPLVVERLSTIFPRSENILILNAGTAPENFSGTLRRFNPDLVVMIDAVDMQKEVGTVAWVDYDSLEGISAFTHAPAPAMLAGFLRDELHCRIALIGVQPGSLEFDQPASETVADSAQHTAAEIKQTLRGMGY